MMNSKEVALMFDLPIDTIRYYERVGVIPPITRDKNGYRIYAKRDLNWIFLAKSLRKAGLSIESLIEFATLAQSKENVRAAQKQILQDQLTEINAKLEEMVRARDLLEYKIETFDDHVAKINAGELNDDEVEELWTMKHFKKQEIPLAVE